MNLRQRARWLDAEWRKAQKEETASQRFNWSSMLTNIVPVPGIGSFSDVMGGIEQDKGRARKRVLVQELLRDPLLLREVQRNRPNPELQAVIRRILKRRQEIRSMPRQRPTRIPPPFAQPPQAKPLLRSRQEIKRG